MFLDKETYERAGLVGKPHGVKGQRGLKPRWAWFAFSTTTFSKGLAGDNAECTILRPPNASGEYLMWEVKGHE
ncbi:hypothetical protein NEMBOFW57_007186 [Staphylotrichum longicolle]|uniref:Uncharacterized protein n=1 Tax=Staphylotrichum longicolle TaxID=669026 RepID=A0AAD4I089_9PEZI|nr:hypothetical protein NEMBOFW57_007186 [Staphylotrichum longicolle]